MKLQGGHTIRLTGRPAGEIEIPPEVQTLYLPIRSGGLTFADLLVKTGQAVRQGQALAVDRSNHSIPLCAPRSGVVTVEPDAGRMVLTEARRDDGAVELPQTGTEKLLALGAWSFVSDPAGRPCDPQGAPRAVIVSTMNLEPFGCRGDVLLADGLDAFMRGLEHLRTLLESQPIYLITPAVRSPLAEAVAAGVRGLAWVRPVQVPPLYPFDNFTVLARHLGLTGGDGPVWCLRTEGVLAVEQAMGRSIPCVDRVISLGGPAVGEAKHYRLPIGYPLATLLADRCEAGPVRVIDGGVFTGRTVDVERAGLGCQCAGLTVLPESAEREMLAFTRPGGRRQSFSRCFLSAMRRPFPERFTTALRGEERACVACGACERVCPAAIWPNLIHKAIYADDLDEVERLRADLCVQCGLCSFVCPSKIELADQIDKANRAIDREKALAAGDGQ